MGDVQLKQQLLNRLQDSQSNLVTKAIRQQVTGTRNRASGPDGEFIQRLAQTARVGKHWLELVFDEPAEGLRFEASNRSWAEAPQARCTDRADYMRRSTGARYGPCLARAPRGLSLPGRPQQRRHCLRVIRPDRIR